MIDLSPPALRHILRTANIFWRQMYFDTLEDLGHCEISLLPGADRLYYNAAHALEKADDAAVSEIEAYFQRHGVTPGIYLDPASPQNLPGVLAARGYSIADEETEYWYGYNVSKPPAETNARAYLKISGDDYHTTVFKPEKSSLLDAFMRINTAANYLPDTLARRLERGLLSSPPTLRICLMLCHVKGVPVATKAMGIIGDIGFTAEAATLADHRRQGLATALAWEAVHIARQENLRAVFVNCDATAYSNQVHQKFGFESLFKREYYKKTKQGI